MGQAQRFMQGAKNLHVRVAGEAASFLFFNQDEMLCHSYLTSRVGPDTHVSLTSLGSPMYRAGQEHFENIWRGRWILFDLGNVLINFDHGQVSSKLWEFLSNVEPLPAPMPSRD